MVERLKFLRQKQCRLIKDFLYINELTVRTAAKKLGVSSTALKYWLNEKRTLPLPIFQGLCKISPELSIYKTYVEERLNDNWGQIKGGKNRIKQISNIDRYLTAIRKKRDSKRLTASKQIKSITSPNNELLNIIIRDGVDVLNILATCLLTDGSLTKTGNSYRICYYSKDVVLKNFTNSLLFKLSRYVPHVITTKRKVYAVRLSDKNLASELLKLSPSYKTNPRHYQSKSSYLSEIQPSIKFIKSANAATQKWCIRFALSTDGCISMSRRGIAELNLACCNPKLVEEWLELFEEYGINGNIGRNKSYWGGISGIRIYDPQSIKNFYKIGGFVPEVLISSKSKRYKGLEKNRLLLQAIVGS